VFWWGVVLFALASIACGFAGGVRELIAARVLQGVGGALLVPGSLALISASFDERARGKAIGTWSAATALTLALGPVLGGWLIDHASWRAAFFMNAPLAIAVLVLTHRYVPESRNTQTQGPLDWPGASLVTAGLGAVVYALIEAPASGWGHATVLVPLALGALALVGFGVAEARHPAPMIPLQLFRSPVFTGANLLTFLLYAALGGALFFVPLDLIQVQGYSTTAAGAALLPLVLLMAMLSRWSGGLGDRYGATVPLVAGPAIAACGFALFILPGVGGDYWSTFFPATVVLGAGLAITVAPLTTTVMNSVATRNAGAASGINNAASRIAGLLAVAAFGVVIVPIFDRSLDERLRGALISAAATKSVQAQRSRLAAIELPASIDAPSRTAAERAVKEAFVTGFRWIMLVAALLSLLSAASAWLLIGTASRREKA
jgi:EmrB/QacA subfamily drug resistance transporter